MVNFIVLSIVIIQFCIGILCQDGDQKLKCYQCRGLPECNIAPEVTYLKPCQKIFEHDKCFEVILPDSSVIRGCKSDESYTECLNVGANCIECEANGCNNLLATLKRPDLQCMKCNTTDDPKCQWSQHNEDVKKCKTFIPKYIKEKCYTMRNSDGSFSRGCSYDDEKCTDENDDNCMNCEENGCNKDFLVTQECIQGVEEDERENEINNSGSGDGSGDDSGDVDGSNDTNINETRINAKSSLEKSLCTAFEQYWDNQGCYVKRNGNSLTWGCAVDLTTEELKLCKKNGKTCKYCAGDTCNDMKAPDINEGDGGGAEGLAITGCIIFGTILLYCYL